MRVGSLNSKPGLERNILLDECLPARLRRDLPGHEVLTVPRAGWAGIRSIAVDSIKSDELGRMFENLRAHFTPLDLVEELSENTALS